MNISNHISTERSDNVGSKPPKKRRVCPGFLDSSSSESETEILSVSSTETDGNDNDDDDYLHVLAQAKQRISSQETQSKPSEMSPDVMLVATQPTGQALQNLSNRKKRERNCPASSLENNSTPGVNDKKSGRESYEITSCNNSLSPIDSLARALVASQPLEHNHHIKIVNRPPDKRPVLPIHKSINNEASVLTLSKVISCTTTSAINNGNESSLIKNLTNPATISSNTLSAKQEPTASLKAERDTKRRSDTYSQTAESLPSNERIDCQSSTAQTTKVYAAAKDSKLSETVNREQQSQKPKGQRPEIRRTEVSVETKDSITQQQAPQQKNERHRKAKQAKPSLTETNGSSQPSPTQSITRTAKRTAVDSQSNTNFTKQELGTSQSLKPNLDANQLGDTLSRTNEHLSSNGAIECQASLELTNKNVNAATKSKSSQTLNKTRKSPEPRGQLLEIRSADASAKTNDTSNQPPTQQSGRQRKARKAANTSETKGSSQLLPTQQVLKTESMVSKASCQKKRASDDSQEKRKKSVNNEELPTKQQRSAGNGGDSNEEVTATDNKIPSSPSISDTKHQSVSKTNIMATEKDSTSESASVKNAGKSPPVASKKKKLNFQDQVFKYMLISCRPFTLKTLAKAVNSTETSLNFLMLSLVDKNLVYKKDFGSGNGPTRELYWANHDPTLREVTSILQPVSETDQKTAIDKIHDLHQQLTSLTRDLESCTREPSNTELSNSVQQQEEIVQSLQQRVADTKERINAAAQKAARGSNVDHSGPSSSRGVGCERRNRPGLGRNLVGRPVVLPSSPRRLKLRINSMLDEWKRRKQKCMDFCEQLADGMEKKVKDVIKLLDVETDDMVNVTMKPKYIVETKK